MKNENNRGRVREASPMCLKNHIGSDMEVM